MNPQSTDRQRTYCSVYMSQNSILVPLDLSRDISQYTIHCVHRQRSSGGFACYTVKRTFGCSLRLVWPTAKVRQFTP